MPSDLFHYAAQIYDGTFDREMSKAIDNASKYYILAANLVWVCSNVVDATQYMVCITKCAAYMPPDISEMHAATISTLV